MTLKAEKDALKTETKRLEEELNREKLNSAKERAKRMAEASKGDVIKAQKAEAAEAQENKAVRHGPCLSCAGFESLL